MNVIEGSPGDEERQKKDIPEASLTFWTPKTTVEARRRKDREDRAAKDKKDSSPGKDVIQDDTPFWGAVIVPPWLEDSRQRQINIEPTGASRRTKEPTTPTRARTNPR